MVGWLLVMATGLSSPLRAVVVSPQSVSLPSVNEGHLLLGELNCTACHQASETVKKFLMPRPSPRLEQAGSRMSPQFIRSFLLNPHAEKPGTTMPDLLHDLQGQAREDVVDELVHYLVSLGTLDQPNPIGSNPFKMKEGRLLYHQLGCVACHQPQEHAATLNNPGNEEGDGAMAGIIKDPAKVVPLGKLARKYTVEQLANFLLNPLQTRPGGRMPSLNLTESEATSVAMYLLRDQATSARDKSKARIQGLAYEYFEASLANTTQMESLTPKSSGMVENFSLAPKKRNNDIAFRYTGYVSVPRDGEYTFSIASDDGTRLYLGGRLLIDNDGIHGTTEKNGKANLKAGDHPIMVTWFNGGGGAELRVSWEGPDLKKQTIPSAALSFQGQPMEPLDQEVLIVDAGKAARGLEQFQQLGCASCHATEEGAPSPSPELQARAGRLETLNNASGQGCLSDRPGQGVPAFDFTPAQREVLRKTVADQASLVKPPSPAIMAAHSLAMFNCYACHSRDGQGGPDTLRSEFFSTTGDEDLGDEGRIPPHLTGVGSKLRPEWLQQVLTRQAMVRPYMATRMPQFGESNMEHLPPLLAKADARESTRQPAAMPVQDIKYGRAMVGSTGLSCISCHNYAGYKSLGIPAMDLTQMSKRLQYDWFHRYLIEPQSLRPGTRMPSFWPEGKSMRDDLLEGDSDRQIRAIWGYLERSEDAGVPPGLIQGKMELMADTQALIYRAFINDSGTRGIGVAFPERAHFTFDANALRPALIWQGPFMDAARHRIGRGSGFEGPLGYNVVKMPAGPPLAFLESTETPWPAETGRKAGYRMRGYRLDDMARPTFQYEFQDIKVEDKTVAIPGDLEATLHRTLTLSHANAPKNLWLRAWVAKKIEPTTPGTFVIDDKIELRLTTRGDRSTQIRKQGDAFELLVPVDFLNQQAVIVEEIVW